MVLDGDLGGVLDLVKVKSEQLRKGGRNVNLVGLYGGIFQHNELARALFERALKEERPDAQIRLPEYPPELGAIIHLMKKNGTLTPETLITLKNSYKEIRHEHA